MKILQKLILSLLVLPTFLFAALTFTGSASDTAYAKEDWCAEKIGWLKCPTEEISFREYKGELVTLESTAELYDPGLRRASTVREFVAKIVNYALSFLGLIAVLLIIFAGFTYLTAGGVAEKTDKAKKTIGYAAIGLLLILGSYAIVNTILTGAFDGEGEVEGEVQGYAATGFNASTESIITSAEDLIGGYKYFTEAVEVFKGLQSDAEKESLQSGNKSLMLQYLTNVKAKLQDLKYKAPKFSKIVTQTNNTLRYINDQIDFIQSSAEINAPEVEDPETPLTAVWTEIKSTLIDSTGADEANPSLKDLLETLKEDFAGEGDVSSTAFDGIMTQLDVNDPSTFEDLPCAATDANRPKGVMGDQFCTVTDVYSEIASLEVFKTTGIPELFHGLMLAFQDLANSIWNIGLDDIQGVKNQEANEQLVSIIQTEDQLVTLIKDIQFVKTKLIADVVEGSAPLIVHFNVLESLDPSGATIIEDNITWDLLGQGFGGDADKNNLDTDCYTIYNPIKGGDVAISAPERGFNAYCVYRNPGAYRASVKVTSGEPDKYAAGISSLDVKVLPPDIKMTLLATIQGEDPVTLVDYSDSGFLKQSIDYITVTESKAKEGIKLDASGTENFTDQEIISYKWDLGNGKTEELVTDISAVYDFEGVYTVTLEVTSIDGNTSRKIFNVIVGSPAARIEVVPTGPFKIGQTITFDASKSSTDTGNISNYEWVITKSQTDGNSGGTVEEVADSSDKIFYYTFEEPGNYDVTLVVADNLGKSATAKIPSLKVESNPPVSLFEYKIPEASKPSQVNLDASKSYDPDGSFEDLEFEWSVDPNYNFEPGVLDFMNGTDETSVKPVLAFGKKGEYEITLRVWNVDETEKVAESKQTINIENTLDVTWSKDQIVTGVLDDEGEAEIQFMFESHNGVAYEINFGDGESETGQFGDEKVEGLNKVTVSHKYKEADKFDVKVTAYDAEDNYNEIKRKIFVGGGDNPVAKISIYINGEKYIDFDEPLEISRADVVTFDASESKNTDGSGRDLNYSWDFGDSKKSSKKSIVHTYSELTPKDLDAYTVTLKVYDKDDEEIADEAELAVDVISVPPRFSSLQALPQTGEDMITPVNVNLQLFGATDPDGKITQYRWWYFDVADPDEILGLQITEGPNAMLIIGTNGSEGDEKTYGFGVEMTDNDNEKISSEDELEGGEIPTISVTNGANAAPVAKINVDRTTVYAGEPVNFSSASTDPDGEIIEYIWDFEGDGFFNDEPTSLSTVARTYTKKNLNGYKVKLKVVDDKHGESISDPVTIFVDSNAEEPKAAFKHEVMGSIVEFTNNSEADTSAGVEIEEYRWDFDTSSSFNTADSDGDGDKANDIDSIQENPMFTYEESGTYQVKLTVVDSHGNENSVTNMVSVILKTITEVNMSGGSTGTNDGTGTGTYVPGSFGLDPQGGNQEGSLNNEPGTDTGTQASNITAVVITNPLPDADGVVRLSGNSGSVTFDFSQSVGNISYYTFDKNIYFDGNSDGVPNNDEDFKTSLPGLWTTNFEKEWGETVVKLSVVDMYGNTNSTVQEIQFK